MYKGPKEGSSLVMLTIRGHTRLEPMATTSEPDWLECPYKFRDKFTWDWDQVLGWIFEKGDWEREEGEPIIDVECDVVWSQKCKRVKESPDCSS